MVPRMTVREDPAGLTRMTLGGGVADTSLMWISQRMAIDVPIDLSPCGFDPYA
jgi:hypothetical protein